MCLRPGIALLLILFSIQASADDGTSALGRFAARYDLSRNGISVGNTRISLELGIDDSYVYSVRTEPSGVLSLWREDLIQERSSGHIVDGRPRPDHYLYHREGEGVNQHLELDFDWDRAKVRIVSGNSRWSLDIGRDTLDKLVQQLVFMMDLAGGAIQMSYRVADGGLLKNYRYRVQGHETLQVPHGLYKVIRADRDKGRGLPDYILWMAPELGYQPVRIQRQHRGSRYQMDLRELFRETP